MTIQRFARWSAALVLAASLTAAAKPPAKPKATKAAKVAKVVKVAAKAKGSSKAHKGAKKASAKASKELAKASKASKGGKAAAAKGAKGALAAKAATAKGSTKGSTSKAVATKAPADAPVSKQTAALTKAFDEGAEPPAGKAMAMVAPPAASGKPSPGAPPKAGSAGGRVLTGKIIDAKTKDGLPAAMVTIKGTKLMALLDDAGKFTITGAPTAGFTLSVEEQDHQRREVSVPTDARSMTVELTESYVEEVVVVGRATEVARKNLANAVSSVKGDDLAKTPAQTIDSALQGKVAGANIQSNSGAPGGGMQIKLRGVSTINGNNTPLYVVDGVIMSDTSIASGANAVTRASAGSNAGNQDGQVNRIADLNPNDVANIEILKGASAAAIYGSKASNGVIVITTKKGKSTSTEPRLEFSQKVGVFQLSNTLGARTFGSLQEAQTAFPGMDPATFTGRAYDHERELSGRTDPSTETYASLTGAAGQNGETTYFASAMVKGDKGIMIGTGYDKQSTRINLGHRWGELVETNFSTSLTHSLAARGLSNNDNNSVSHYMVFSATPSFMNLNPDGAGKYPRNPFVPVLTNPLQTATLMKNDEDVWRLIGSADALWNIWKNDEHAVKANLSVGVDRFQQKNKLLFPPELFFERPDDGQPGTSLTSTSENLNVNWGVNAIHSYKPTAGFLNTVTTSTGVSQEVRDLDSTWVTARNITPTQSNVDNSVQVRVAETRVQGVDRGGYVQEEALMMNERLQLVGAVRGEQSSLNGDPNALFFYPKVAASYRMEGMPSWFDECKLRAAFGETGNLSPYGSKFTSLNAGAYNGIGIVNMGATVGDPNIKPERQREFEVGVDTMMLNGKAVVELTAYQRNITDMLLNRLLPPSTGFTQKQFNGGELINRGFEAMGQLTPIETDLYSWTTRVTFALNRSVIESLPVPAFDVGGFGVAYGVFHIEQGKSATQIIGNVGKDAAGKNIVGPVGDAEPDFKMSFVNDVKYGQFSLSSVLEWQQGSQVINLTRALYDGAKNSVDYTTGGVARRDRFKKGYTDAYIEDGSFLKVREITLSFEVPPTLFAGQFSLVKHAKLSLSGRNLLTFTKYSGLDPEVSNFGNQAIARNIDVAPFPPSRSFWGTFEVGF